MCSSASIQDVEQHVQIGGACDKGLVFFDDHDLCVSYPREIGVGQITFNLMIGRAAEAAELGVIIEIQTPTSSLSSINMRAGRWPKLLPTIATSSDRAG